MKENKRSFFDSIYFYKDAILDEFNSEFDEEMTSVSLTWNSDDTFKCKAENEDVEITIGWREKNDD